MSILDKLSFPEDKLLFDVNKSIEELPIEEHKSKQEGVNELRRSYDEEEDRRKSLESKTGAIIAINGILLSLLNIETAAGISIITVLSAIFFFVLSILISIYNLWPRGYQKPLKHSENPTYTKKNKEEYLATLYRRYFVAVSFNTKQNDVRYRWYLASISSTALGIIFIALTSIDFVL